MSFGIWNNIHIPANVNPTIIKGESIITVNAINIFLYHFNLFIVAASLPSIIYEAKTKSYLSSSLFTIPYYFAKNLPDGISEK